MDANWCLGAFRETKVTVAFHFEKDYHRRRVAAEIQVLAPLIHPLDTAIPDPQSRRDGSKISIGCQHGLRSH